LELDAVAEQAHVHWFGGEEGLEHPSERGHLGPELRRGIQRPEGSPDRATVVELPDQGVEAVWAVQHQLIEVLHQCLVPQCEGEVQVREGLVLGKDQGVVQTLAAETEETVRRQDGDGVAAGRDVVEGVRAIGPCHLDLGAVVE
jgi:hypothetical protein